MRYKRKPLEVEAERWSGGPHDSVCISCDDLRDPHVHALEGRMVISPGDWIVTGIVGRYPVRRDIFEASYEAMPEDGQTKPGPTDETPPKGTPPAPDEAEEVPVEEEEIPADELEEEPPLPHAGDDETEESPSEDPPVAGAPI